MIDLSLVKIIPADESHREFSYRVKKEAYGAYVTATYGWEEQKQIYFHDMDWQQRRVSIIVYREEPIGTIYINKNNNEIEIGEFFILPQYQNQGIGSNLLRNILADADKMAQLSKVAVLKINPVISLYRRYGFEIVNEDKVVYFMERKPKVTAKNDRKYQAVIFDLFGTLIKNFSIQKHEDILREMASILCAPTEDFIQLWYDTFNKRCTGVFKTPEDNINYVCHKLGVSIEDRQKSRAACIRFELTMQSMIPKPESIVVLSRLKSEGYRTALVTDCSAEVPAIWQNTPFAPLFDVTVFSCLAGMKKPDPRIYRMAAEQLKVEPQRCLYVGDGSSQELTGAAAVGMHPVLIRDPEEASSETHRVDAETDDWHGLVISSLKEVLNLLK